jgi:hypothetical protein
MSYIFGVEKCEVAGCRRMDSKSESEEMIYPYVCFSVDNFDEAFEDIQVLRYLRGRAPPPVAPVIFLPIYAQLQGLVYFL